MRKTTTKTKTNNQNNKNKKTQKAIKKTIIKSVECSSISQVVEHIQNNDDSFEDFMQSEKQLDNHSNIIINGKITDDKGYLYCPIHKQSVQFVCTEIKCLMSLCGHCILEHKEHIDQISSTSALIDNTQMLQFVRQLQLLHDTQEIGQIVDYQQANTLQSVDEVFKNLYSFAEKKKQEIKHQLQSNFTSVKQHLNNVFQGSRSKGKAGLVNKEQQKCINSLLKMKLLPLNEDDQIRKKVKVKVEEENFSSNSNQKQMMNLIKDINFNTQLLIQESELQKKFNDLIQQNIIVTSDFLQKMQSSNESDKKVIHWFEWGKRKLHLYDISTNTTECIELDIHFKIPSFSRSILLPDSKIYLLGGEEPEFHARRDMYVYDLKKNNRKLEMKEPMPYKKYDFAFCFLDKYLYVISGKKNQNEIVESCERYSLQENKWSEIAPVSHKRYAASAIGSTNGLIYLFGGRREVNNSMVHEIEAYDPSKNLWKVLSINNNSIWQPVEVCAILQISPYQILMFGGSDVNNKDTANSYIFDLNSNTIQKHQDLKRPSVFVNSPFIWGKYAYVIGNEYYMKARNLHRFDLQNYNWTLFF